MTRNEVYRDIEESFGFVPTFVKYLPDDTLEHDWLSMKAIELEEGKLGNKTKHLIGLAVSGAIKCHFCTLFHTVGARKSGATDEEISETLRVAMDTTGWSTYLNGMQFDYEQFKRELEQMGEYMQKKMEKKEAVRSSV